jgi:hypothetical protein
MINKEEFKNLAESSVNFSSEGVPYLILKDDLMICPFCLKRIKMSSKKLQCECENSKEFSKKFIFNISQINDFQKQIILMKEEIQKKSIEYFKGHFQNFLLPQLQKEFDNNVKDILSI